MNEDAKKILKKVTKPNHMEIIAEMRSLAKTLIGSGIDLELTVNKRGLSLVINEKNDTNSSQEDDTPF